MPTLVSSYQGRIETLLLCLPGGFVDADPGLAGALLSSAPEEARCVIVTHRRVAEKLESIIAARGGASGQDRGHRLIFCPDERPLMLWAQDALLCILCEDGQMRLAPSASSTIPPTPSRNLFDVLEMEGFPVFLREGVPARGGNLLIGDDFVLIGADEWRRWCETFGGEAAAHVFFTTKLDSLRRPIVVGGGSGRSPGPSRPFTGSDGRRWRENIEPGIVEARSLQPAYHLDLYISLVGRDAPGGAFTVLVGDMREGAALLGLPPPAEALAQEFDAVAAHLAREGFRVLRNPLPLLAFDDVAARRRLWAYASPNNALVENDGATLRRVTLPRLGATPFADCGALDAAMMNLWSALGYHVRSIPGLLPLIERAGGLHCVAKVLERGG